MQGIYRSLLGTILSLLHTTTNYLFCDAIKEQWLCVGFFIKNGINRACLQQLKCYQNGQMLRGLHGKETYEDRNV